MAFNARKTEHAGPKKGRGAFYGRKAEAKAQSNRRRRENAKLEVRASVEHPEGVLTPNKSLHLTGELLMLASPAAEQQVVRQPDTLLRVTALVLATAG